MNGVRQGLIVVSVFVLLAVVAAACSGAATTDETGETRTEPATGSVEAVPTRTKGQAATRIAGTWMPGTITTRTVIRAPGVMTTWMTATRTLGTTTIRTARTATPATTMIRTLTATKPPWWSRTPTTRLRLHRRGSVPQAGVPTSAGTRCHIPRSCPAVYRGTAFPRWTTRVSVTQDEADDYVEDQEPVVVFEANGEAKAYPLQILTWHEIVNDEVGGLPVSVTYCPLCNSAVAFDRRLGGVVYDFGTSGNLRNSDLIMWDRQTESWWQQLTGEAIVGELAGKTLTFLPAALVSYGDFKQANPEGLVLSRETGYPRDYGSNPYTGYDKADSHRSFTTGPSTTGCRRRSG